MRNNKKIGIIGGVGPQSTNYIYNKIISYAQKKYHAKNNDDFPEIIIHSVPIPDFISNVENIPFAQKMLISCTELLTKAGCTIISIGSNTVHILKDELQKTTHVPFLSMIDLVAQKCTARKYMKVALLGSPILMKSGLYQREFEKNGVHLLIPNEDQFHILDHMIRSVLAGKKEHEMKDQYVQLMNTLYDKGAETIILGCTELPLAINYEALGNRTINSDEVLADGLVDYYYQ